MGISEFYPGADTVSGFSHKTVTLSGRANRGCSASGRLSSDIDFGRADEHAERGVFGRYLPRPDAYCVRWISQSQTVMIAYCASPLDDARHLRVLPGGVVFVRELGVDGGTCAGEIQTEAFGVGRGSQPGDRSCRDVRRGRVGESGDTDCARIGGRQRDGGPDDGATGAKEGSARLIQAAVRERDRCPVEPRSGHVSPSAV